MKKLLKLGSLFLTLTCLNAHAQFEGAEPCKPEGMAADISEDFLWVLKGNKDIITDSEYQAVLDLAYRLERRHAACVDKHAELK